MLANTGWSSIGSMMGILGVMRVQGRDMDTVMVEVFQGNNKMIA